MTIFLTPRPRHDVQVEWTSADGRRSEGRAIGRDWSGALLVEWREMTPGDDLLPAEVPGFGLFKPGFDLLKGSLDLLSARFDLARNADAPLLGYACRHMSFDLTTPEGIRIQATGDTSPREGKAKYGTPPQEHEVYKIDCFEDGRPRQAAIERAGLPHPSSFPGRLNP